VGLNVFQSPVFLFKFAVPSLFAYEICGPLWFFGPLIYMILFSVSFTALVYFEQKKWLVKPSYMQ